MERGGVDEQRLEVSPADSPVDARPGVRLGGLRGGGRRAVESRNVRLHVEYWRAVHGVEAPHAKPAAVPFEQFHGRDADLPRAVRAPRGEDAALGAVQAVAAEGIVVR